MSEQNTQEPVVLVHAAWLERSLTIGAAEAAGELRRLHEVEKHRDELAADVAEESAVREKLAIILAETAVALKGPEAALFRHSWHDLAEVARKVVSQRDELLAELEDKVDIASIALRNAWQLGQTYWQQVDSDYESQHKKSEVTQAKFQELVDETRAAIANAKDHLPDATKMVKGEE